MKIKRVIMIAVLLAVACFATPALSGSHEEKVEAAIKAAEWEMYVNHEWKYIKKKYGLPDFWDKNELTVKEIYTASDLFLHDKLLPEERRDEFRRDAQWMGDATIQNHFGEQMRLERNIAMACAHYLTAIALGNSKYEVVADEMARQLSEPEFAAALKWSVDWMMQLEQRIQRYMIEYH